jgi:hypothetical protein
MPVRAFFVRLGYVDIGGPHLCVLRNAGSEELRPSGWVGRLSFEDGQGEDEEHHADGDEDEEQDLGDACGCLGYPAEAEQGCYDGDDEEYHGPFEQSHLLILSMKLACNLLSRRLEGNGENAQWEP